MRFRWCAVAILLVGCRASFESNVREYIQLAVALGERDPDSLDFYSGPAASVADIRRHPPPLVEIRRRAEALHARLAHDSAPRAQRLAREAEALAARAGELLGAKIDFDQAAKVYFGIAIGQLDSGDEIRREINGMLPGGGSLAERYAAFDGKFLVAPDRLPLVFERALAGCREQTRQHLSLPDGERVSIEYVHNKPWSAFSSFRGNFQSVIQVNADLGLTVDRTLDLACHEGYPGHHAMNVIHESQFVRAQHWDEWTVQPSFSPRSLVSEALATLAAEIAFPGEERVRFERDVLFPMAGLDPKEVEKYVHVERLVNRLAPLEAPVARDFSNGNLEWSRAAAALEAGPLMAHPEQTLKYINEYRSYMLTYTIGASLASRHVRNWQQLGDWMRDPDAAARIIMNP